MIQELPMFQLFDRDECAGRTFLRLLMERTGDGQKVTVRDLAEAAGVSRSLIGNLLTGKTKQLPYDAALRAAERLGVDGDVLWVQAARSVRSRESPRTRVNA
ncbi:helix-turn-helix domain-containing protein [Streptomyces sp. NBC_01288]|uniref:helix-turn-helix domain-containing protein n=1 Tax=Streptomyces sp. NBC_01288 TaxID=2903814 RepID=UPI002E14AA65|nr:helix-turn-helix domain-containing protein [Streptomyces sp. NBC_01288]